MARRHVALGVVATALLLGGANRVDAQTCTEATPGVARVDTGGVAVTLRVIDGVPRINGTSCGFVASARSMSSAPRRAIA